MVADSQRQVTQGRLAISVSEATDEHGDLDRVDGDHLEPDHGL
jgi:hypothetical protein